MAAIDTTKIVANENNAELAMQAILDALNNLETRVAALEAA
jgi:hypothetical protein